MASAYSKFVAELRAEGPSKKDGFDLVNLRKLSGGERDEARTLLQQAVADGDDTAVAALVALDGAEGLSFLRARLADPIDDTGLLARARIVDVLLDQGRPDPDAERALVDLVAAPHAVVRQAAIASCERVWSDDAKIALLRASLRIEPDALNRLAAANALLRTLGRTRGDGRAPDHAEALAALRSGDADARDAMLARLGAAT